jgi:hypothetical protein
MAKRKNQAPSNGQVKKKRAISDDEAHKNFRSGLFDSKVLAGYTDYYAASQPYALPLACFICTSLIIAPATSMP